MNSNDLYRARMDSTIALIAFAVVIGYFMATGAILAIPLAFGIGLGTLGLVEYCSVLGDINRTIRAYKPPEIEL